MPTIAYNAARHEDCRDLMSTVMQNSGKLPFLQRHLNQSIAVTDTTHKWGDKALKGNQTTLGADITNNATTLVLATGSGAKTDIFNSTTNTNCLIQVDNELIRVTAGEGTDSLTVTRGYAGTTGAAHTTGATVTVVRLNAEGVDNERNDAQLGTKTTNYTQIYRRELSLSATSQAVNSVGGDVLLGKQIEEKLKQIMDQMEIDALTSNVRYADGTELLRKMGGLKYFATKVATASVLTSAFIEARIIQYLEQGGDPSQAALIIPHNLYSVVMGMKKELVVSGGFGNAEKRIVRDYDTYEYGDCPVEIIRAFHMPAGNVCIYDKSNVDVIPLRTRALKTEGISKKGDNVEGLLVGEYTMEVRNGAETAIWYTNVTAS